MASVRSGVTCQLVQVPTPFFLAAQRRTVSAVKKKLPKGNPWEGFPLDSFGNKRVATLLKSRGFQICSTRQIERLLRVLEALSFWSASTYWFGQCLTIFLPSYKSGSLNRRKAFLLCKNPCGAGCNGGRGSSLQRRQPPRKEISRGNLLCAESGLPSLSYPSTREYSKVRRHARFVILSVPGSPESQRGCCPSVWEGVQREPFQGFPLGNFFAEARHGASLRS